MKIWHWFRSSIPTSERQAETAVAKSRPWEAGDYYVRAAHQSPQLSLQYAEKCIQIRQRKSALKILEHAQAVAGYKGQDQINLYHNLGLVHQKMAQYSFRPSYHRNLSAKYYEIRNSIGID